MYWRRWYENNGRLVYRRCFRYSLDVFIIGQVVALALFEVLKLFKLGGAVIPLIPLTAFIKLVGTRWFDKVRWFSSNLDGLLAKNFPMLAHGRD